MIERVTDKRKEKTTIEGWYMENGLINDVFFSKKSDSELTSMAIYYQRKIQTERCLLITGSKDEPEISKLTRVKILDFKDKKKQDGEQQQQEQQQQE